MIGKRYDGFFLNLALVSAALLLSEPLHLYHAVVFALIVTGIVVCRCDGSSDGQSGRGGVLIYVSSANLN